MRGRGRGGGRGLAMRAGQIQGREAQALSRLNALPGDSKWHYYLRYNLGADYALQQQWPQASSQFDQFAAMEPVSAEARALRDRGLTAAGFAYLSAEQPAAAQQAFRQVSLTFLLMRTLQNCF